jgi:alkyl hydroperoxide reductase subunit D
MSIAQLQEEIPDYAKDLKLNLGSVLNQAELTPQQTWGTALACAIAARNPRVVAAVEAEAADKLSPEAKHGARVAAAVMGMNNIYYRFQHLVEKPRYKEIPARLRMQTLRTHGADPVDFELWCLAVSAINGCQTCVMAHERVVLEKGLSEETVVASVRIASILHALAAVFDQQAQALTA